jgi:cytidyltransferase-like protein
VVYIGGTWDLLHAGHLSVLQQAREHGDYLIVGIYSDALASVLHSRKNKPSSSSNSTSNSSHSEVIVEGKQEMASVKSIETNYDYTYPILSMEERMLSLLGCKHVSDVLMNAPHVLTSDFLSALGVNVVITDTPQDNTLEKVEVKLYDNIIEQRHQEETVLNSSSVLIDVLDPLKIPREKNILKHVQPTFKITGNVIAHTHTQ